MHAHTIIVVKTNKSEVLLQAITKPRSLRTPTALEAALSFLHSCRELYLYKHPHCFCCKCMDWSYLCYLALASRHSSPARSTPRHDAAFLLQERPGTAELPQRPLEAAFYSLAQILPRRMLLNC